MAKAPRTIVVLVDASSYSKNAVRAAIALSSKNKLPLVILHCCVLDRQKKTLNSFVVDGQRIGMDHSQNNLREHISEMELGRLLAPPNSEAARELIRIQLSNMGISSTEPALQDAEYRVRVVRESLGNRVLCDALLQSIYELQPLQVLLGMRGTLSEAKGKHDRLGSVALFVSEKAPCSVRLCARETAHGSVFVCCNLQSETSSHVMAALHRTLVPEDDVMLVHCLERLPYTKVADMKDMLMGEAKGLANCRVTPVLVEAKRGGVALGKALLEAARDCQPQL